MPQPLTSIRPGPYTIDFFAGAAQKEPKLAAMVLSAISLAAKAEADNTRLIVPFTHGHAAPVVDYFLSLRSDAPKQAVIEALAAAALTENRFNLFKSVARLYETAMKARQPLAHWIVGHCVEIPEALLFLNPKTWLKCQALFDPVNVKSQQAYLAKDSAALQACTAENKAIEMQTLLPEIQVYREKDLADSIRLLQQAMERLVDLHMILGWDRVSRQEGDKLALALAQKPEIANLISAQPKPQPDLLTNIPLQSPKIPPEGGDQ